MAEGLSARQFFGFKCWRCSEVFETVSGQPDNIYCLPCRAMIRRTLDEQAKQQKERAEQARIRAEVAAMEWPDVIGV